MFSSQISWPIGSWNEENQPSKRLLNAYNRAYCSGFITSNERMSSALRQSGFRRAPLSKVETVRGAPWQGGPYTPCRCIVGIFQFTLGISLNLCGLTFSGIVAEMLQT